MKIIVLSIGLLSCALLQAQTTIGSDSEPSPGSILDVKQKVSNNTITSTKGFNLPRVILTNIEPSSGSDLSTSIGSTGDWDITTHVGLLVYNTKAQANIEEGIYVWTGKKWEKIAFGK